MHVEAFDLIAPSRGLIPPDVTRAVMSLVPPRPRSQRKSRVAERSVLALTLNLALACGTPPSAKLGVANTAPDCTSHLDRSEKAVTEPLIRQAVQAWAAAITGKDIERVLSFYSPELVSFDLDPPLRYAGLDNKRRAWAKFFEVHTGALHYDVTELSVTADSSMASVHSLNHVKGELANGQTSDMWVRWTAFFRNVNGAWVIVHDHASVPVDVAQGKAALDLIP